MQAVLVSFARINAQYLEIPQTISIFCRLLHSNPMPQRRTPWCSRHHCNLFLSSPRSLMGCMITLRTYGSVDTAMSGCLIPIAMHIHIPNIHSVVVKRVSSYRLVSCKSSTLIRLIWTYFSKILPHVRLPETYDARRLELSCLGGRSCRYSESLENS